MMVRFLPLLSLLFLGMAAGCGQAHDERGASNNGLLDTGRDAAQDKVVYCDDVQRQAQATPQQQRTGIPYTYPGQECMQYGPDGEPLVNVNPNQPMTNPGQTPDYADPRYRNPGQPNWQTPGTYPQNPQSPNQPRWDTPPTYPQNPQNPSQPNWQTPGTYPNNPNNPGYSTPGYDGEPLPY